MMMKKKSQRNGEVATYQCIECCWLEMVTSLFVCLARAFGSAHNMVATTIDTEGFIFFLLLFLIMGFFDFF